MEVHAFTFLLFTVYFSVVTQTFFSLHIIFPCCLLLVRTDGKSVGKQLFDRDAGFISHKIKKAVRKEGFQVVSEIK